MPPSYLVDLYYNDFDKNARELSAKNVKMTKQSTLSALFGKIVLSKDLRQFTEVPYFIIRSVCICDRNQMLPLGGMIKNVDSDSCF